MSLWDRPLTLCYQRLQRKCYRETAISRFIFFIFFFEFSPIVETRRFHQYGYQNNFTKKTGFAVTPASLKNFSFHMSFYQA
tara:strand:- start:179 stop:421 length:243 start_codon:yes stop_codon:yes gene_type:complete